MVSSCLIGVGVALSCLIGVGVVALSLSVSVFVSGLMEGGVCWTVAGSCFLSSLLADSS